MRLTQSQSVVEEKCSGVHYAVEILWSRSIVEYKHYGVETLRRGNIADEKHCMYIMEYITTQTLKNFTASPSHHCDVIHI